MQRGKLPFGWIRIDYRMRSSFTTGNMYSRVPLPPFSNILCITVTSTQGAGWFDSRPQTPAIINFFVIRGFE